MVAGLPCCVSEDHLQEDFVQRVLRAILVSFPETLHSKPASAMEMMRVRGLLGGYVAFYLPWWRSGTLLPVAGARGSSFKQPLPKRALV